MEVVLTLPLGQPHISHAYDNAGNQTALIIGAATNAPHTTSYAYNKLGQVICETDAMGGVKTATYDYLGNVYLRIEKVRFLMKSQWQVKGDQAVDYEMMMKAQSTGEWQIWSENKELLDEMGITYE